jgi:hypothetical protein
MVLEYVDGPAPARWMRERRGRIGPGLDSLEHLALRIAEDELCIPPAVLDELAVAACSDVDEADIRVLALDACHRRFDSDDVVTCFGQVSNEDGTVFISWTDECVVVPDRTHAGEEPRGTELPLVAVHLQVVLPSTLVSHELGSLLVRRSGRPPKTEPPGPVHQRAAGYAAENDH